MEKDEMYLASRWLTEHGGRTFNDVSSDEIGKFVMMQNGQHGQHKVYIPSVEVLRTRDYK